MRTYSKELLEKTIKAWQPYCHTSISLDTAKEIIENMNSFIILLKELEQKYAKENKNI